MPYVICLYWCSFIDISSACLRICLSAILLLPKILAVVTARSGSKGLPDKNIRPLCEKPLLAWTIEFAISSGLFDDVILSTDSPSYAQLGIKYGANVPFIRPTYLAEDESSSIDVVLHALDSLRDADQEFDLVVLLEPTSPLRYKPDIKKGIQVINDGLCLSAVSIAPLNTTHPSFALRLSTKSLIQPYQGYFEGHVRRQDLTPLFYPEGTFYISSVAALRDYRTFYHEKTAGIVTPQECHLEIDNEFDFHMSEFLLQRFIINPSS